MTKATTDVDAARALYVREVADCLGLRDWAVFLRDYPPPDGCLACIDVTQDRKVLELSLGAQWAGRDPHEVRSSVVHELLHAHLNSVRVATGFADGSLGAEARGVLRAAVTSAIEQAVDAITTVVSRGVALPTSKVMGLRR